LNLQQYLVRSKTWVVRYEHVWIIDDFLMWDNLCSMHARTDFPVEEPGLLRRGVVEGEPVIAA
jgi:alpha-ketoglutarate-dependent taurine dioxygenase